MFLTTTNLLHYLMGRGLVTAGAIVDGELCVIEAGRRNRKFKVVRSRAPGLFVKQVSSSAPDAVATLHREAAFYTLVQARPAFQPLAGLVPRLVHFEPATCALVVEARDGAENLTEHHLRVGGYPPGVGTLIGEALGRYHAHTAQLLHTPQELLAFPRQTPWIFTTDPRDPAAAASLGAGGIALGTLLQEAPHVMDFVRAVGLEWQFDCVTHGDMKWDNLLIYADEDGRARLQVVDWELADLGDAVWDAASIVTAYLSFWIWTTLAAQQAAAAAANADGPPTSATATAATGTAATTANAAAANAAVPFDPDFAAGLAATRPALIAFWRAYAAARGIDPAAAEASLPRLIRFSGARLVLALFECLFNSPQITTFARAMLHVSHVLLTQPERALADLLGTPAERTRA